MSHLPVFILSDPTNPSSYREVSTIKGCPLNWQDDVDGRLQEAVMAYLNQTPTPKQLQLVIAYIQHHIHAPCWLESSPFGDVDGEMATEILELRELSLSLTTREDVNAYIHRALDSALDPL